MLLLPILNMTVVIPISSLHESPLNILLYITVLEDHQMFSVWPVVMHVHTLSALSSDPCIGVSGKSLLAKKDRIWVTVMLLSVTTTTEQLCRPQTQGTLSSINEESVPVGLVFVKPNYIRSFGKVRINLLNPFWMCRMHHRVLR